jgi:hypothetical protein
MTTTNTTNPVITKEQARKITGGREPFDIVEYEQALALLRQCISIDDAKRFATFADAKAAWAKVLHDQTVLRLARALKLHAVRRMAQLAELERPTKLGAGSGGKGGAQPGSQSLLQEAGMTAAEARGARKLAKMSPEVFQRLVTLPRPPSVTNIYSQNDWTEVRQPLAFMLTMIRKISAADAARRLVAAPRTDIDRGRVVAEEITVWLDEFLQRLPKKPR